MHRPPGTARNSRTELQIPSSARASPFSMFFYLDPGPREVHSLTTDQIIGAHTPAQVPHSAERR